MANIQYGGSGAGTLGWAAGKLFNQGVSGIQGAMDSYSGRIKNRAINDVLGQEKLDNEDAVGYQTRINTLLGNVDGLDPLQRLNLSTVASKPVYQQELVEREAEQQMYDRGVDSAKLVQESDKIQNTQDYRDAVTTETKRHNGVMEIPNDIREATQAGYPSQMTRVRDDGRSDYRLTEEDFGRYQEDKAAASYSSRTQSDETKADLVSKAAKRFEDSLDESQFEQYNKLDARKKQNVLKRYFRTGVIPYKGDSTNWYQGSDAGFDSSAMDEEDRKNNNTNNSYDVKYIGNKAYTADGTRSPENDK